MFLQTFGFWIEPVTSIALNRELKMYAKVFPVIFYHNTWNFWKLLFGVGLMTSNFYSHSNEKNVNMRSVF